MTRRPGPAGAEEERAYRLIRRLFDRKRQSYERKLEQVTEELRLLRGMAAVMQSRLERSRST